ncbi:MAG TPA: hypothetical protein QF564_11370 [Pirellulaceae bacterium]|nr:hypothetical protein [Pirellulaceae bacterium]
MNVPTLQMVFLFLASTAVAADVPINPVSREVRSETLAEWTFDGRNQGWKAQHDCTLSTAGGELRIRSLGDDPYLHCKVDLPGGQMVLRIRAKCQTAGNGGVYWETDKSSWDENKSSQFRLKHDGQWREYDARFSVSGQLTHLRIDPGTAPGQFEIDWIELVHEKLHPLTIVGVVPTDDHIRFKVKNDNPEPVKFSVFDEPYEIDGHATLVIDRPLQKSQPLEAVSVVLRVAGWPLVRRSIFVHHSKIETDWIDRPLGDYELRVARDGSMARIERQGDLISVIGPLAHDNGKRLQLRLVSQDPVLRFQGEAISITVSTAGDELSISIVSQNPCTGPVVRHIGSLEQGLLAGLEYLGKGERSSSRLDVETEDHLRFAPDPLEVTMPLMAFVTDKATVAMTWNDTDLQPLFATPNFFDGGVDHFMALKGKRVDATIRVDRAAVEETVLWAVKKRGLPPLPQAPRSAAQQWKLCMQALNGPLKTDAGWGHCAGKRWQRRPYGDMASTVWRLTGAVVDLPEFVPGGAHIDNDAIFFVSGRAEQWLQYKSQQVQGILARQQADGSFRYEGKYRRGHFENTASGICAQPALELLEYARITGDRTALEAGVRALEYMKRFRTPRGAQTWEVPLHTPDLLASASLVWAYVHGFELTGKREYIGYARKWALSGLPFVYLWERYPIMAYATPPVYGATNWQRPMWIGFPVQWVGGVYAYAITKLAAHDDTLDWKQLARGILIAAEQMQYPDGPYAGLLPDAFTLEYQERVPARINPCALVSLRLVLDGKLDSLAVASDGDHRVVAPFPVTLKSGRAHIRATPGISYQAIVDGKRVVDVESNGDDIVTVR